MAKKKITEIVKEMLQDFLDENGYELYNTEFIKEGKDWFLRVYIDKLPQPAGDEEANDGANEASKYISTDDCEKVSRYLSEMLDAEDPIERNYYLEVSSPGMDRPLLEPRHYERYIGSEVEIRLYKGKDGTKNIAGVLDSFAKASDAEGTGCEDGHDGTQQESNKGDAADDYVVKVTDHDGKEWTLLLSEIAKTKLAVIF